MSFSPRIRFGLIAALGSAGMLSAITATASADTVRREDGKTIVRAPTTHVETRDRDGATRVKVRAPHTRVDVDTDRGHVRIRVPYYSGDIRW